MTLLVLVSGPLSAARAQTDEELAGVTERLEKANRQTAQVMSELKALDRGILEVTQRVEQEEAEVAAIQARIRSSEVQSSELRARLEQLARTRDVRARQIYKDGPASIVAALFAVRSLDDFRKFSIYYRSVVEQDARMTKESMRLFEKVEAEKAILADASAAVARRAQELKQKKDTLRSTRDRRRASLGSLRKSIVEAMAARKALLAAKAAAEAARAAAEAAKAASQKAATPVRPSPGPCVPGKPAKDQRLAALLNWYAPAAGSEPFMPPKLESTDVVFHGVTSWYGPGFEGCATSSGATFRSSQMTAASLSLPLGTLLKVTNGRKSVVVVITDRGPYVEGRDLDLSKGAAAAIAAGGVSSVRMEVLLPNEPAPPFP